MAKRNRRHGKESEYHLGIIRELKKEIKNLKQRIKSLERMEYHYIQSKNMPKDFIAYEESKDKNRIVCPKCKDSMLTNRIVAGRVFDFCEACHYRSAAKKVSNV